MTRALEQDHKEGGGEGAKKHYRLPPSNPSSPPLRFTYIICIIQIPPWAFPPGRPSPHDAMLRLHVDKAISGNWPKSANVIFVLTSPSWWFSLRALILKGAGHPDQFRSVP